MQTVYPKKLRGWRFVLFNVCLGLSHALVLFNAGAYIAMLPRVAAGLSIPPSFATWTQTDYMIGLALGFPIGNWLSRRVGEYRSFVWAFVVFGMASLICAYCHSLYGFLGARIVLGFSGGITLPIGQSMILKEYPDRIKTVGIGLWSLFTLTPFTFGPLYGGWIADNLGWRWLFKVNVSLALAISGILAALLYKRGVLGVRRRFDTVGFVLLAVSMFSFQTLLNQGNDWDWGNSDFLVGLMVLTFASLAYWIVWELGCRNPFLDIQLFSHRNFALGTTVVFLGFLFFQGLLSLLIVQLQLSLGYSSYLAALVFLPMVVFGKPIGSIYHNITRQFDARFLASLNLLGFAAVYFWLSRFDHLTDYAQLFWPKLVEGIFLGTFFLPLTTLLLHGLPAERQWRAIELAGMLRIAAGAFGISLQGIVFYQRAPFHFTRFSESHTAFDTSFNEAVDRLGTAGFAESTVYAKYAQLGRQQSAILAMNDAFWIAGWVFTGLAVFVWLAYPTLQPSRRTAAQSFRRRALALLAREEV